MLVVIFTNTAYYSKTKSGRWSKIVLLQKHLFGHTFLHSQDGDREQRNNSILLTMVNQQNFMRYNLQSSEQGSNKLDVHSLGKKLTMRLQKSVYVYH